jgi:probable O-glycosylation ligase (exosortase A-associated)
MSLEGSTETPAASPPAGSPASPEREPSSRWTFREVPDATPPRTIVVVIVTCAIALFSAWLAMTFPPRPAAAMFLALVGGALILFNPFLGVLAYYTLAFMRPQEVFWGFADTRLTLLVSISTLAATAFHFLRKPNLHFLRNAQCLFIGILWLFIFLSTQFGEFGGPEPKWVDYYNKMFLTILIVLCLANSEKKLLVLSVVIGLSIGYLGVWANEMYFLQGWHIVHGPGGPGATFHDENDFAMVLVMAVPFLWYMMRASGNLLVKAGLVGLMGLVVHGVMLTFSRGGFLGVAASMMLIALREKNRVLGALLIIGGLSSFVLFTGTAYRARIGSINTYEEDQSATGRFESWEAGQAMALHNPLFGVGLKRYVLAFPSYSSSTPRVAHNSWVQLGAECGLVALGAYAVLILLTIRSLLRVEKRMKFLTGDRKRLTQQLVRMFEAALAGYLICGFFLSVEDFEFFYVLVAMVQVLDRITEQRAREDPLSPAALAAS